MFTCNNDSGYQMVFANGCRVSVQWGQRNYCKNLHSKLPEGTVVECPTAEIAAWDANDNIINLSGNVLEPVMGWQTTDEVLKIIQAVASRQ